MFTPDSRVRVYACLESVDLRKSFSGLSGAVRMLLREDPLSGHAFLFFNRRRTYLKVLWWDRTGYCIVAKQLVRGTFGKIDQVTLTMAELSQVLAGIELQKISHRKLYQYHPQ